MFNLSPKEWQRVADWQTEQGPGPTGAIGGRWTYKFTPTSLGIIIKVIDNLKKTELDLTEYEDW